MISSRLWRFIVWVEFNVNCEIDEEDVVLDPIQEEEALELLSRLRLYEEQQADGDTALTSHLKKYEREIGARATC